MFENLFTTLKNRANSLNDNIKSKSRRLTTSFDSLKNRIYNKTKPSTYYTITPKDEHDYFNNEYLSPRAYSIDNFNPDSPYESVNMEWVPYFPPTLDEHSIIDRFLRVVTINEDVT
ncbi:hypothetical protein ILUMI_03882, partial [Ignelater luminosus]